ncbi:MAG: translocation/assembly module TamB domain-containing protein [Acidaminococcaceae bacterium]|nr:translocation/assembly module TamB domain-containing protein [Acidaminococcaceae bacterium]
MNWLVKWLTGIVVVFCVLFFAVTQLVLPDMMKQAAPYAEKLAADYVNGTVQIGSVTWSGSNRLLVQDIVVKDQKQQDVAIVPKANISVNPFKALSGLEKAVSVIDLEKPTVYIKQDKDERWNYESLLKPSQSETTPFYGKINVQQGTAVVQLPEGTWQYQIEGFVDGSYNPAFDLNFKVDAPGMATAKVLGSMDNKGVGKVVMKSDRVDLAPYHALALRYGQVKEAAGQVTDIDGEWSNDGKNTVLRGKCGLRDVRGRYQMKEQEVSFRITGDVSSTDHVITVDKLQVSINEQAAILSGVLDIHDPDNPEGHLSLQSDKVTYDGETFTNITAEAVLAGNKAAVNYLSAAYRGGRISGQGVYELASGKLTGAADIRKVTLDGEKVNGERFLLNAVLAGSGTYDREEGRLNVNVAADTMNLQWRDTVLNVMDFDADLTNDGAEIRTFSALTGTGALQAAGRVSFDGGFDLAGRMANMPLAPVLAVAGQEGSGFVSASSYHVYGGGGHYNFEGPVQLQDVAYRDMFLQDGQGLVTVRDNVAELKDFQLTMDRGSHTANGTVDLQGEEPRFDLALETEKVRIEPLLAVAKLQDTVTATGNLTNRMRITGTLSDLEVQGEADMSDGSVEGYLVDSVTGRYFYHGGTLRLDNVVVKALSATLKLHGVMDSDRHLDFQADAADVDLSRLPIREESIVLAGYASAQGHLSGTMETPLFAGNVTSEEFFVNKVSVKNLQGVLVSNGKDINSLKGTCEQTNTDGLTSAYMIDLTLNIPQRDLRGKMGIMYGDLQNILKMAKVDFPIKGLAAGTLEFNGPNADTVADFWGYNLDINGVKYDQMALKARFRKGILTVDSIKLQEDRDFYREGTIALRGTVDFRRKTMDMRARAVDANPAILTAFMQRPVTLTGSLNMTARLEGPWDKLKGNGSAQLVQGSLEEVAFDRAAVEFKLDNNVITLDQFSAEQDMYKLTAVGGIPVDVFREKGARKNPDAQMDIQVDFNQASLAVFGTHPRIDWGVGSTKGLVKITGTLEDPRMYGNIKVEEGCLKLKDVHTLLDKVAMNVVFNGSRIIVETLAAELGKGTLEAHGSYDFRAPDEQSYLFNAVAKNAEVESAIFKGRINGSFAVSPEYYRIPKQLLQNQTSESGNAEKNTVSVPGMEEGWRPKIAADILLDDLLINMPTIPSLGEGNSNLGMDVSVKLGSKVHLYNKYLYDLWLKGMIHATGSTVFPRIDGSIDAEKGTVTYLRTRFKVDKGSVRWPQPGSFLPHVKLNANTKFSRYRIALQIDGSLRKDNLDMKLQSNPYLSQNAIVRMLTLQRTSAGSDDITNEDMQNLLIAGLETGLLGDVEQSIRKALGIDEFRIYVGKVENGVDFDNRIIRELTEEEKEQYNFLIAKNLTDRWKIGYTSSFDGRYNNIYTQYQLTEHMNITLSQNEDHDRRYSVEYRITF